MGTGFGPIEHVVVLMLENRSFDNILGETFEPGVERVNHFFPSGDDKFPIPIPGFTIGGRNFFSASIPTPDPGENFQFMNQQIFGLRDLPPVNSPSPTDADIGVLGKMGGFVQNYLEVLAESVFPKLLLPQIMHLYKESQVPVSAALGRAFAVVDTHHASAPCQTMPNRCFAQLGTAQGYVNNDTYDGSFENATINAPYFGKTIFGQINDTPGVDWKVYFGDFPLTLMMADTWLDFLEGGKFHFFDKFKEDVERNQLPAYTWIEPAYQLFPTDNHPPHDINLGEFLLQEVYNTLRGKQDVWEKTLLIVTYDEHGGCYDHVFPSAAVAEPDFSHSKFKFDRYGVRVPTLLISPYIKAGTVGTPGFGPGAGPTYDHTSILASVRKCFDLKGEPLSNREKAAADYEAFLTLSAGTLNQGPASVSVGLSKAELEFQALLETVSGLGQLWLNYHRKIPTSTAEAHAALAALEAGTYERTPNSTEVFSDKEMLSEIEESVQRLFGRRPIGVSRYE